MARVTVEDCLGYVENRFHLVIIAAKRARQLAMTAVEPRVKWDKEKHKSTVIALREIANGQQKHFGRFLEVESTTVP